MKIKFGCDLIELKPTKILAVAKNYVKHINELKLSMPSEPKIFLKPPSSLVGNNGVVIIPGASKQVDYEVELAAIIRERCWKVSKEEALDYVLGFTVFNDITARDIQAREMKEGMPWDIAKGFNTFAPIGPEIITVENVDCNNLNIWLKVNGEMKQNSNTKNMIFSVEDLISYLSNIMTLEPLDIIATGTPEGVGSIKAGDSIESGIEGIGILKFKIEDEK
ncbi:fumarylacetoacetate hydrolase family protein [candidate division WOR-3 bacterium]|nr:fumarylacetoacetate hydrolase family protein [candidate division WOR-3 bacterium]